MTDRSAELEARQIVEEARALARKELESARRKARDIDEQARKDGAKKLAEARAAADSVLEDAKALGAALKVASKALSAEADKLVRDVQVAHRELLSELRLPGVADATRRRELREAGDEQGGESPRQPPTASEVFELPDWVGDG